MFLNLRVFRDDNVGSMTIIERCGAALESLVVIDDVPVRRY
jgi:predicted acetyltransferase